ncbi:uncharacterized protein Z519_08923 [Cladophialophora bantiana CBS 173.52]|uniref:EcxA zinc-binding domain-containing protein n=1 Tax=Cladophialophora bantiana (strain ATCC 10958 / CBS 173.52 / CDC B-1940 / NIH 8579) TaxID=1442370 RepID=A0A0D2I067_CLAB1|nr:uncharacterized protein Z519_08923 [Cladophialophora bantiana CBS 173.52]KIW90279.1 hypothetical protein Z519_08923 [Cladophialophora bantiana CBS 173.52]
MSDQVTFQPTSASALKRNMLNAVETKIETLTLADLENPPEETKLLPLRPGAPTLASLKKQTQCSLHRFVVGVFKSTPRWKLGSTINFAASATAEWNSHNVGVTFNGVSDADDAAFVLAYGGDNEGVLASAFFPDAEVLNTLRNVFLHELGHVLGLRHEFALGPALYEEGAFRMATTNPESVMSFEFPPENRDCNALDTSEFDKLPLLEFFALNN